LCNGSPYAHAAAENSSPELSTASIFKTAFLVLSGQSVESSPESLPMPAWFQCPRCPDRSHPRFANRVKAPLELEIRIATENDRDSIEQLIFLSARELSRGYYSDEQIAAALARVYGVDSALIDDGTYFVAEADGMLVGCGGWSKRKTLFGGDQFVNRDPERLDPGREAAKIRAFFVHPNYARRGIARALLARCETEAQRDGFNSVELMSTLPGVEFYRASGFSAANSILYDAGGVSLEFVPMKKALRGSSNMINANDNWGGAANA